MVLRFTKTLCFTLYFALLLIKECAMSTVVEAVVSSKGQVTLPAAMRAKLGIVPGSRIQFELRERELVVKPELPMSAYYGMLKKYNLNPADLEIVKDPYKEYE
jgi:AbrB family looped-hinge helix DNA binding protein